MKWLSLKEEYQVQECLHSNPGKLLGIQVGFGLSKSGVVRISTTKIVKLNTGIKFFIINSKYLKKKCSLVSQLAFLFSRHEGKFIIHKNKKICWLERRGIETAR